MYQKWMKQLIDSILAVFGILVLFPILFIIAFVLFVITFKSPFFSQKRVGKNKIIFNIIKFKTMNKKKDKDGNLLSDEERITPFGSFLRKTSLDELPQLLNVLVGDMSLVGPRPLLTHYMHLYTPFQDQRHLVKPGITGWAQVNGRNSLDWDSRFALDVFYVANCSLALDFKILVKTIPLLFKSKEITAPNSTLIEPFNETDY